jgi:medium-chain acyl-CoA ligase, mitochondrial
MIAKQKKMSLDLPEIDFSIVGAAICTPKLVKDARKYLKIKNFMSNYGMTETSAAGFQSLPGEDENVVLDYVGCVTDNVEVKVVDREGNTVPFGTPGELCLRGYCTMLGYWNDEKKTKECLDADKW